MKVVICGAGVIGASIACFLARRGAEVAVVERTGVACAASGRSGGFLALDWCDGTPLQALARRSFALHAELAEDPGADWGYRRLTTYGGVSGVGGAGAAGGGTLPWLSDRVTITGRFGNTASTAQVHPARFTRGLMREAETNGARLIAAEVTGIRRDPGGGRATGFELGPRTLEADAVVIAMGPWSRRAAGWLPLPAVHGLKGHSLVFETGDALPAEAVFLEHRDGAGGGEASPELYPRDDGTTYVCGLSSEAPLPDDPAAVAPDPGAWDRLQAISATLAPALAAGPVLARQTCYRPVTRDGLPLIGAVPGVAGAYVATGHSVWGMLNAPATGEAVAELILDGAATTVDLAPFDPARMPAGRA
jgi:glycine/D-amino acid oxidase-like deaminating enzyme